MSKIKSLEQYTEAILAVAAFRDKNGKVLEELDSLKVKEQETEHILKTDVKDNLKMNIANDVIKVTYSPAFRKGYNYDIILEKATPKMKKAFEEAKAVIYSIDKKKFEDLVEQGIVPVELKQEAFEEVELAPRVTIKEVKNNEQEKDS